MRILVVCLLGVLAAAPAFGSDGLSFGILGGLSRSNLDLNYTEIPGLFDPDARLGLHLGGFAEYRVAGPFSAHLGVDYVERGFAFTVETTSEYGRVTGEKTYSPYLSYVSIPLLLKWQPEVGRVDPFAVAGPKFDIKVGQSGDLGWDQLFGGFRETQWGMSVGGGVEVAVTPTVSLILGAMYSFDFENAYETELLTIKRESLDIVTGVRF